jgi:hypothetical protein
MAIEVQHDFWGTISAIGLGLIGVASIAAVVSKNSNTSAVIQSSGNAFSQGLSTALSPVTGGGGTGSSLGLNLTNFPIG